MALTDVFLGTKRTEGYKEFNVTLSLVDSTADDFIGPFEP
jgi:hypothetical protein